MYTHPRTVLGRSPAAETLAPPRRASMLTPCSVFSGLVSVANIAPIFLPCKGQDKACWWV